ncbi:MAG: PAS domain S-box protein [Desulfatibacillum sp.]|nr:PAS domain S-box protein [Desulfatibacillum sp.]
MAPASHHSKFHLPEMGHGFFKAVTESGSNLVVAHNRRLEIIYASPAAKSFGYAPGDMLGKIPSDFLHPDDWPRIKAVIDKCLGNPGLTLAVGDLRARHKKGGWWWFQGQYTFFSELDGDEVLVFMGHDVTARKRAENKAMELRIAVEQSLEGFAVADMEGAITYANTAWARMHGLEAKEIIGKNLGMFHSPEQMKLDVLPFIQQMLDAGSYQGEVGHVRKDGTLFPAWHSDAVLRDNDGKPSAIMAVIHDITSRKNAEIELKKSEIMYRTLVEQSLQGVAILRDRPLRMVYCNPALEEMMGCSAPFLYDQNEEELGSWIHPDDYPVILSRYQDRVAGKQVDPHFTLRVIKKDGSLMWLETVAQLITHQGQPATLGLCRDITDRRRLEENLKQARKMEAIGTLAGGIAHNLNNILYPIMGYTEMIADDVPKDSRTRRNLDEVLIAVNRAKDLVYQILAFSHKSTEQQAPTELGPVIHEVVRLMRGTLPVTINIVQDISGDTPAVMTDPSLAHQAALNLCTNAFHAMRDTGGVLEVLLQEVYLTPEDAADFTLPPGRYARLTVRDTGVGIDPLILDRIFEPYFTTREVGEGTGMGLSEAHAFARHCGGDIFVKSTPGKGSRFEIFLPAVEQEPPRKRAPLPVPKGKEIILLTESDMQIRRMNTLVLQRLGYTVLAVRTARESLEALGRSPGKYDLIISELNMPIMNGAQLAREALAIRPDIPIILCTGFAEGLSSEEAESMGVAAVVKRPMRTKEVARVIRDVLDSR